MKWRKFLARRYWKRESHLTGIDLPESRGGHGNFGAIAHIPIEWHRDKRTGIGHERGRCRDDCPFGGDLLVLTEVKS